MLNKRDECYKLAKSIQSYISPSKPFETIFSKLMLMNDRELSDKKNEVASVKNEMTLKRS